MLRGILHHLLYDPPPNEFRHGTEASSGHYAISRAKDNGPTSGQLSTSPFFFNSYNFDDSGVHEDTRITWFGDSFKASTRRVCIGELIGLTRILGFVPGMIFNFGEIQFWRSYFERSMFLGFVFYH